ncbi:MAG: sensor histidine kinase [Ruminococcaceae bacterium]|nr:sensor histidine kinase [Oscillospiraceae bacterium]
MKELSLNILDIAENSVKARADKVEITLTETDETLEIKISDNGCGMKPDFLAEVTDPFTTTRTTRKVGLGIPLFKMASEQTGGALTVTSKHEDEYPEDHGTVTAALFYKNHLDFTPLGDVISTLTVLIQGSPDIRWVYTHTMPKGTVSLDTNELKAVLGEEVPLNLPEVLVWISDYLKEQYGEVN